MIGLSGGLDSAVVAALACEALGPENVLSVMMPSPYSSRSSIDDSVELGKRLGMNVIERPITEAFHVLLKELNLSAQRRRQEHPCRRESAITFARQYPDVDLKRRRAVVALDR